MLQKGRSRKNIYLSQLDQREYMKSLREAAESGDVNAMGWMVLLTKVENIAPSLVKSGWAGEEGDPKQQVLAAIRENDPKSGQLPENQEPASE